METKDRVARVDGRFVHWVRGYGEGVRYSLIFFATDSARAVPATVSVYPDFVPKGDQRSVSGGEGGGGGSRTDLSHPLALGDMPDSKSACKRDPQVAH